MGKTANQNLGKAPLPLGLDIRFVVTNLECGSPEWRPAGQGRGGPGVDDTDDLIDGRTEGRPRDP